jgi:hypothetical protein
MRVKFGSKRAMGTNSKIVGLQHIIIVIRGGGGFHKINSCQEY